MSIRRAMSTRALFAAGESRELGLELFGAEEEASCPAGNMLHGAAVDHGVAAGRG